MKKLKGPKSLNIVGGAVMGHPFVNAKNHASKGIVADMPIHTNIPKLFSKKNNAKKQAVSSIK